MADAYYKAMLANYKHWKKNNFVPGALATFIESAKMLCELNIGCTFNSIEDEQPEEEHTEPLENSISEEIPVETFSAAVVPSSDLTEIKATYTGFDNSYNFKKKKKHH
ncbi:MAG: hypothetical protein Q4A15_12520 [Prevotellaceae bacterium]|nr:hypothetical protein [Prevotellaceae bacterium]